MIDDIIDEELQIAKEQDERGDKVLNSKMFELPISELSLPKAICLEEDSFIADALSIMQEKKNRFNYNHQ